METTFQIGHFYKDSDVFGADSISIVECVARSSSFVTLRGVLGTKKVKVLKSDLRNETVVFDGSLIKSAVSLKVPEESKKHLYMTYVR